MVSPFHNRATSLDTVDNFLAGSQPGAVVKNTDGFAGYRPEVRRMLQDVLRIAGERYPSTYVRVQPRDANTQTVYTLAVLPKTGNKRDIDPAFDRWRVVATGRLEELLAFVQGTEDV